MTWTTSQPNLSNHLKTSLSNILIFPPAALWLNPTYRSSPTSTSAQPRCLLHHFSSQHHHQLPLPHSNPFLFQFLPTVPILSHRSILSSSLTPQSLLLSNINTLDPSNLLSQLSLGSFTHLVRNSSSPTSRTLIDLDPMKQSLTTYILLSDCIDLTTCLCLISSTSVFLFFFRCKT
jgi:hypothetical protein